jgi:hypothetical protein
MYNNVSVNFARILFYFFEEKLNDINSIFELEMYSGSKHKTHCFYYDIMFLLIFMRYRYHMNFTGFKFMQL